MKHLTCSIATVMALSTLAIAGGDIEPAVAPMEEIVAPAPDDSGFYVGAGISFLTWEDKVDYVEVIDKEKATWTGGTILAGYQFNSYIAAEGRYTMSFSDASLELNGIDIGDDSSDLSNIAIYLKPMYPIGDFTLYGLLGYGQTTIEFPGGEDHDDSGFQWGIGAGYNFTEAWTAFIDYTMFYDDDSFDNSPASMSDFKVDSITVGVSYKF